MANKVELKVQADIVKSVKADGGWAKKLSHRFVIGIPDLLIALYPTIPFLAEVKDLGEVGATFSRKVDTSPKQAHELTTFDEVYYARLTPYSPKQHAAVVIVGWVHEGTRWLTMLPHGTTKVTHEAPAVHRRTGGYYPIGPLIELYGGLAVIKEMG